MCEEFLTILTARQEEHWPWTEKRVPDLGAFCHPLYSTFSAFRGFSQGVHQDQHDSAVSTLVNFGQHAILELPEYGRKVSLQPLDITLIRTNTTYHRTSAHPAYTDMDIDDIHGGL